MKNILYKTIILLFLISINASAKEKGWEIIDFKKFISLQFPGKITHGDRLDFNFSKSNCDRVRYYFSIYSAIKNPEFMNLKGKPIPLNINGVKTWADTIYTTPFLMGYRGMFYLGAYQHKDISDFFQNIKEYEIKVVDRGNFQSDKYFDINLNQWNLEGSSEAFKEAYNICKSKES